MCARCFEDRMFGADLKNELLLTAVPSIFLFNKRSNVDVCTGEEESEVGVPPKFQILSDIVIHSLVSAHSPLTSPPALLNIVIHPVASSSTSTLSQIPLISSRITENCQQC